MQPWSIKCYGGRNGSIERWFSRQVEEVQAEFSVTLAFLREVEDWLDEEEYKDLEEWGDCCDEFGEILFSTPAWEESEIRAEHRAIGLLDEREHEFIILWVETKKVQSSEHSRPDSSFYERVCGKADDRLQKLERGEVQIDECSF